MFLRLGLLTALCLAIATAQPGVAQSVDPAAVATDSAKVLFDKGRYADAIASYRKIQSDFPTIAADAQRMIGQCYQREKEIPKAVSAYKSLLTQYPDSEAAGEAYYWLGLCDEAQGNAAVALTDFSNEVKSFPANTCAPLAMLKIGEHYEAIGQYDDALKQFNAVLATSPEQSARANLLIGICYQSQRKYDEARAAFQKAVDAGNGSSNEARLRIDEVLRAEKKYPDELTFLQTVHDTAPELRAQSLTRQAEVLSECVGGMDGAKSAIEKLRQLISECPADPLAMEAEARIARIQVHNLRDFATAEKGLRDFMKKYPDYPNLIVVAYDLAFCSYLQRNYAVAAALFTDATKLKPTSNYVQACIYFAADCCMRTRDFQKAKANADLLISKYPDDSWARSAKTEYANLTGADEHGDIK